MTLRQDPKAWEEGFTAGETAKSAADAELRALRRCPYLAGSTEAWSWHSGFVEGDAKRQGYSYSRGALPKEPPPRGPIIV